MNGQLVCQSLMASLSALLDGRASILCLEHISMHDTVHQSRLNSRDFYGDSALDLVVVARVGLGLVRGVVDVFGHPKPAVSKCGQVQLFPARCVIFVWCKMILEGHGWNAHPLEMRWCNTLPTSLSRVVRLVELRR
jgi:hypothetical protein